jgi:hypothetical protein
MDWDCMAGKNCFNEQKRLKFGVFYDCLPGKISMSDVDGTTEVNGHFLFIEFKESAGQFPYAQWLYYSRLTRLSEKIVVLVIEGDAWDMSCYKYCEIAKGVTSKPWARCDLADIQQYIKEWSARAGGADA